MNGLALCSGIAGIELGLKLALGESYRTVCYVEREACSAATLVDRMEDSALDLAPVWDCVETFDGRPWRGFVDIVTAGFPCQPFSLAGKRQGKADARWIWPDIDRIIREVGPRFVLLENVPGILSSGLGSVLGSLAASGFNVEWDVFSAAEVGAPHLRRRVFIFAYTDGQHWKLQQIAKKQIRANGEDPSLFTKAGKDGASSDADNPRCKEQRRAESKAKEFASIERSGWWTTQSGICGVDDGIPHRVDRLRALGNGVVPLVAAVAFRILSERVKSE